jgi:ATP-dependent RNA helicase RhlE
MGFIHDIKKVIQLLPKERQNVFFSATMPPEAEKLANAILRNPNKVEVTPVATTAELIEQSVMFVESKEKMNLLKHLLKDKALKRVIVFARMKHIANKIAESLTASQISAEAIHGNKSQSARQRALENFKAGKIRVLVATDLAARGIDVDNITHVINFELPNVSESYVHRIGRTARAGAQGLAIAFCNAEERAFLRDIEKLIGEKVPIDRNQPYHSEAVENARVMSSGKAKAAIEGPRGGRGGRSGRNNQRGNRKKNAGARSAEPRTASAPAKSKDSRPTPNQPQKKISV